MKMKADPAELRFTHDSIASHFHEPYEHIDVREAAQMIQEGKLTASFKDPLRVVKYNEHLWALDNRRLWVFRIAQCPQVKVCVVGRKTDVGKEVTKFLSAPETYKKLSSPSFLPEIREILGHTVDSREESSILHCVKAPEVWKPNELAAECCTLKMGINPADLRFTSESIANHFQEPHQHVDVREAVQMVRQGKLTASGFQDSVRVVKHKQYWWALNNRRLWVFRTAECPQIRVEVVGKKTDLGKEVTKFLSDPETYKKLSSPSFLPAIRESLGHTVDSKEESAFAHCVKAPQVWKLKELATECCTLKMDINPADLRFTCESIVTEIKKPHHHVDVREAVQMIRQGKLTASGFQDSVRVVNHKENWWAIDNCRLWVFRMAECPLIKVEVLGEQSDLGKAAAKSLSDPAIHNKLSRNCFLPILREVVGNKVHSRENCHFAQVQNPEGLAARTGASNSRTAAPGAFKSRVNKKVREQTEPSSRLTHYRFELVEKGLKLDSNLQHQSTMIFDVNPADLRFTQGTVSCHFQKPFHSLSVLRAVEMIQTGSMSPGNFPRLRVMFYRGCWWSLDNRRLWVYRMAKCSSVTVNWDTEISMHDRMKGITDYPSRCRWLSRPNFLPKVTGIEKLSTESVLSPGIVPAMQTADGSRKALPSKENSGPPVVISVSADPNGNASSPISAIAGAIDVQVPQVQVNNTDRNHLDVDERTPLLARATAITRQRDLSQYVRKDITFQQSPPSPLNSPRATAITRQRDLSQYVKRDITFQQSLPSSPLTAPRATATTRQRELSQYVRKDTTFQQSRAPQSSPSTSPRATAIARQRDLSQYVGKDITFQQSPHSSPSTSPLLDRSQNDEVSTSEHGNPPRTVNEGDRGRYWRPLVRCIKYLILVFCATPCEWDPK